MIPGTSHQAPEPGPGWLARWLKACPRIGDGAIGTMLQQAGLPLSALPETWNLEQPEQVLAVHEAYREAGAGWLQTNSFGGNRLRLRAVGLTDQVEAINAAAVRLAREAAGARGPLVAGTLGPTGARVAPRESPVSPDDPRLRYEEAVELYAEQSAILAAGGVDFLLIETMSDPMEAVSAIRGAQTGAKLPVVATMTFGRDGLTPYGEDPVLAAARLAEWGADAVGTNCSFGPESLLPVIERMRAAHPDLPLVAQPSAGLPRVVEGKLQYDIDPAAKAAWARRLIAAGADLVGGCCGTTPEHIRAVRAALNGFAG